MRVRAPVRVWKQLHSSPPPPPSLIPCSLTKAEETPQPHPISGGGHGRSEGGPTAERGSLPRPGDWRVGGARVTSVGTELMASLQRRTTGQLPGVHGDEDGAWVLAAMTGEGATTQAHHHHHRDHHLCTHTMHISAGCTQAPTPRKRKGWLNYTSGFTKKSLDWTERNLQLERSDWLLLGSPGLKIRN